MEYSGKTKNNDKYKCPACGMVLRALSSVCPGCGTMICIDSDSEFLEQFTDSLAESDLQIIFEHQRNKKEEKRYLKIAWVILNVVLLGVPIIVRMLFSSFGIVKLSPAEKEKESLINNLYVPNDYNAIVSTLLLTSEQMKTIEGKTHSSRAIYWANTWQQKAEILCEKAKILVGENSQVNTIFASIESLRERIKKKYRAKAIGSILLWIAVALLLVLFVPKKLILTKKVPKNQWPKEGLAREIPEPTNTVSLEIITFSENEFVFKSWANATFFRLYVNKAKDRGFSIDAYKMSYYDRYYEAKNDKGYKIQITKEEDDVMTVRVTK